MGEIDTAVRYSKLLESLLEELFQATGKGLHEKTSSVEDRLPENIVKKLRYIASVRNKAVHSEGYSIDDLGRFTQTADEVVGYLETHRASQSEQNSLVANSPPENQLNIFHRALYKVTDILRIPLIGIAFCWQFWDGWTRTGIGAGLTYGLIAAGFVALLISRTAVDIFLGVITLVLMVAGIFLLYKGYVFLWGFGKLG